MSPEYGRWLLLDPEHGVVLRAGAAPAIQAAIRAVADTLEQDDPAATQEAARNLKGLTIEGFLAWKQIADEAAAWAVTSARSSLGESAMAAVSQCVKAAQRAARMAAAVTAARSALAIAYDSLEEANYLAAAAQMWAQAWDLGTQDAVAILARAQARQRGWGKASP